MKTIVNVQTGEVATVPLTAEEIAEREAYERDVCLAFSGNISAPNATNSLLKPTSSHFLTQPSPMR